MQKARKLEWIILQPRGVREVITLTTAILDCEIVVVDALDSRGPRRAVLVSEFKLVPLLVEKNKTTPGHQASWVLLALRGQKGRVAVKQVWLGFGEAFLQSQTLSQRPFAKRSHEVLTGEIFFAQFDRIAQDPFRLFVSAELAED